MRACSRAELALLLEASRQGTVRGAGAELAPLLGYARQATIAPAGAEGTDRREGEGDRLASLVETAVVQVVAPKPRARFLQVTAVRHVEQSVGAVEVQREEAPWEQRDTGHALDYDDPRPLVPWPRLWRQLRGHLSHERATLEVDLQRLQREMVRARPITALPRLSRPRFEARPRLVLDGSSWLMPFWFDQDHVCQKLGRWLARGSEEPLVCLPGIEPLRWLQWQTESGEVAPWVGVTLLLLGDLGAYGGPRARQQWRKAGEWLRERGAILRALCPCPPWRLEPGLARLWNAIPWDARERHALPLTKEERERRAEALLELLSPANRIELGLLRAARALLPPGSTDSGTEVDALHHPAVSSRSAVALTLKPEEQQRLRRAGAAPGAIVRLLRQWHARLPREVLAAELFELSVERPELPRELFTEGRAPNEPEDLRAYLLSVARALDAVDAAKDPSRPLPSGVKSWFKELERRLRGAPVLEGDSELTRAFQRAWVVVSRGDPQAVPPAGLSPEALVEPDWTSPLRYELWQRGAVLEVMPSRYGESNEPSSGEASGHTTVPALEPRPGSWVANFEAARPELIVAPAGREGKRHALPTLEPIRLPAAPGAGLRWELTTDREQLTLRGFEKPPWAQRVGRDRYGLYADFEVRGVTQRLRWIAPGRFLMGAPEDEPEHGSGETLHEVTLTEGYWLGDTACTQALWEAVMGENPSWFQDEPGSGEHPVETVSWEDCVGFLERINSEVPGLELRLPTEAEWEYACRAGTTTPFNVGATITPEQANYNGNYPNAGAPEGEYRGKTMPVKSLEPNAWGLWQMHGNVWEWCEDWWGDCAGGPEVDPKGRVDGKYRVVRGGSWRLDARDLRFAYRSRIEPSNRVVNQGFRVARGRDSGKPAGSDGPERHRGDAGSRLLAARQEKQ